MIVILSAPTSGFFILTNEEGHEYPIHTDYDYPRLAEDLGMVGAVCGCGLTDGTTDCEHRTATDMIEGAACWLSDRDGELFSFQTGDDYPELFTDPTPSGTIPAPFQTIGV